jgi:hypothetical protein
VKRGFASILIGAALLASGCTQVAQQKDKLLAALDHTEQVARTFTYAENANGHKTVITGTVADDLRYRLDASIDGQPAASEVVDDDARAVELSSAAGAALLVPQRAQNGTNVQTPGSTFPEGKWLEDPNGASSLLLAATRHTPGQDPFGDALTALEYVRFAISQAVTVQVYNPDSESYRPKLDVFPAPPAGVIRYDLTPPDLPPRQRVGTGGNIGLLNQVPGVPFFRIMAVYVRNGLIVDVKEEVSILPRLADPQSNLESRLNDFTSAASQSSPLNVQAAALQFSINRRLAINGQPQIRPRVLDLSFGSLGHAPAVALPQGAAQVDMSNLGTLGLVLYESH